MLSQEILDLYKKSRLMTYRAMFGRIREKTGSLSATEAYAVDVIYLLGSPTITQLAETLGISQPNATYKVNNLVAKGYACKTISEDDKRECRVTVGEPAKVKDCVPSVLLLGTVVLLIAASFIPERPALTNGFICMGVFVSGMIYTLVCKKNAELVKNALTEIDFQTLLLLAGLFIVIGSLTYNGIIDDISQLLVNLGGSNLFLMYTLIVWASVLFSAFIDNIPYVATMLPVVAGIASRMGCAPHLLYFGLLVGATLGGNLTPIGASANIAAIGILRKAGYEVKTKEFLRIGVPFTLLAVLVGYLFCWFIWS